MAYLAINGYELPPPKRGVSVIVTTVVDSGRDANGAVVGQRVGRDQYKIDGLEWPWLTAAQWERILSILSNFFQRPGYEQSQDAQDVPGRPHRTTVLGGRKRPPDTLPGL